MNDFSHLYGGDLQISANGDFLLTSGAEYGQQRVLRRLLTNPLDDPWNPLYGAGLPRSIGQPAAPMQMEAIIRTQLANEQAVSADPAPSINVSAQPNGTVLASVSYADAATAVTQILSFPVGG